MAQGYLLKSIRREELLALLKGAIQGEAALTPALAGRMLDEFRRVGKQADPASIDNAALLSAREQEILILASTGATNKEIADKLCISIHTVRSHMRKLLDKLQVANRREATVYARREGLLPPREKSSK